MPAICKSSIFGNRCTHFHSRFPESEKFWICLAHRCSSNIAPTHSLTPRLERWRHICGFLEAEFESKNSSCFYASRIQTRQRERHRKYIKIYKDSLRCWMCLKFIQFSWAYPKKAMMAIGRLSCSTVSIVRFDNIWHSHERAPPGPEIKPAVSSEAKPKATRTSSSVQLPKAVSHRAAHFAQYPR